MDNPVIVFGAGGLGKTALSIFRSNDNVVYCFLDDDKELHGTEINEVSVAGRMDDDGFLKYIGKKCEAFVAVDDNELKKSVVAMLKERRKVMPVNAVHRATMIDVNASMGHGNLINAGTIMGPGASLGNHCIIHSRAVIDYDCKVGDFVQIGAGSVVNGGVEIGDDSFIGSGCVLVSGIKIGNGARIGAGSVVISDVEEGTTLFGNPAKPVNS